MAQTLEPMYRGMTDRELWDQLSEWKDTGDANWRSPLWQWGRSHIISRLETEQINDPVEAALGRTIYELGIRWRKR